MCVLGRAGAGHSLWLAQTGAGHSLQLAQTGAGHSLQLAQTGAGHSLQLAQTGAGHSLQLVETGAGHSLWLAQTGTGCGLQLAQTGAGHSLRLAQTGAGCGLGDPVGDVCDTGVDARRALVGTAVAPGDHADQTVATADVGHQRTPAVTLARVLTAGVHIGADHAGVDLALAEVGGALGVGHGLHGDVPQRAGLRSSRRGGAPAADDGFHVDEVSAGRQAGRRHPVVGEVQGGGQLEQ